MLASAVLVALAVPVPTSVDPVNIQRDVAMVTEPTKKGPVAIGQIQGNANTLSCDGALTSRVRRLFRVIALPEHPVWWQKTGSSPTHRWSDRTSSADPAG